VERREETGDLDREYGESWADPVLRRFLALAFGFAAAAAPERSFFLADAAADEGAASTA